MVSQPVVDQNQMDQNSDPRAMYTDSRRVKTTMPGARARKGKSSLHMGVTTTGIQQASMQINDGVDTDKDPDLDMQDIQKPNSMESSMNSASQAP